jgi:hypothetical protein
VILIKKKLKSGIEVVVKPLLVSQAARIALKMSLDESESVEIIRDVYVDGEKMNIDDIVITVDEYLELLKEATEMNFGKTLSAGE